MSYKQRSNLEVPEGGTGTDTFVAYSPVTGGTTSTGSLQSVASLGSSGQVLTSTGASSLPTFQDAPGGDSNVIFMPESSDPGGAVDGDVWFNTAENEFRGRANSANYIFNVT